MLIIIIYYIYYETFRHVLQVLSPFGARIEPVRSLCRAHVEPVLCPFGNVCGG